MLRLFLLLPLWSWDPGTLDCHGQPEPPGIRYPVTQLQTEPAGFVRRCAVDEETGEEVCHDDIVYQPVDVLAEDLVDQAWYPDELVFAPPLGGVTFIDVEAMDEAGNVSVGPCL